MRAEFPAPEILLGRHRVATALNVSGHHVLAVVCNYVWHYRDSPGLSGIVWEAGKSCD